MGSGPPQAVTVETITIQLAGLELTITARRLGEGSPRSSTVQAAVAAEPHSREDRTEVDHLELLEDPHHITVELEERALSARTASEFGALPLPFLDYLLPRLRGTDPRWLPPARIGRAFTAGVASRRRLDGEIIDTAVPGVPYRNQIYICLRTSSFPGGFWTSNYSSYIEAVGAIGPDRGFGFRVGSISHSFPTRAEGEAYLIGARRGWPRHLQ